MKWQFGADSSFGTSYATGKPTYRCPAESISWGVGFPAGSYISLVDTTSNRRNSKALKYSSGETPLNRST